MAGRRARASGPRRLSAALHAPSGRPVCLEGLPHLEDHARRADCPSHGPCRHSEPVQVNSTLECPMDLILGYPTIG
jgi:hypothetical protein